MDKFNLTEFCKKLSLTDKRIELIGGFFHYMKYIKKVEKATDAQFREHYEEFCNMPA